MSTVLVVDDEPLIIAGLSDDLREAGYVVLEAYSADAAIGILQKNSTINFVISDIRMPGTINGIDLAIWLEEHQPHIPIVLTSGFYGPDEVARMGSLSRTIHVETKPYRLNRIIHLIRTTSDRLNAPTPLF